MEALMIEGNEKEPQIIFDPMAAEFLIKGSSLSVNAPIFYRPVLEWLNAYHENPNPRTEISIKLDHFNTASSVQLLAVLLKFNSIASQGNNEVIINWYYNEEDILESGQDYEEIASEIEFIYKAYK